MKDSAIHKIEDHRYRVLIDNAPEAVFILDLETGKFIDFNQNALDFFHLSSEELCTKGPLDLSPLEINGQPAHMLASTALEETMRGGNPVFDWVHYGKDQNEVPCEIRLVRFPPYDKKLVRASLIDKSEQKKTKEALDESQERLKLALYATGSGYTDFYPETGKLHWDERIHELFGLPVDAQVDRHTYFFSILHPEDQERVIQNSLYLLGPEYKKNTFRDEYRIIKHGKIIHLVTHGLLLRNDQEKVYRIIGTSRDITQEKEAERQKIRARQLELKNKELEQFAYVASHDLQEPIRTITGFVGLLKLRYQDKLDKEANEHLEYISQAGTRMNKLIKALLDYTRIGRDKKITSINIHDIVENTIKDLSQQVSEAHCKFDIGSMPKIKGYEMEIQVLFQNLISNAIKFRKEDVPPLIHISSKKKPDHWEFCISDNGIGIDPQFKEKIFVIFQRLQSRGEYEGTGIGLAHCQKIVDLHGGKIWVESTLGEGSSFYFTIPE